MNAKIDGLIHNWKDEILEMLKGWIAVNSVQSARCADNAPYGQEARRMLDLFLKDAAALGFQTDDVDGYAASAEMGEGEQTMGILAHLDIVPAGEGWTRDPFGGEIDGNIMYGRGVQDDKGPALAALFAMRAVKEAGIPLKHAVRLIVGCDEETGMSDMRYYAKMRQMPDYGFSPDAEYPLINIEKGGLTLRLSKVTGGETAAIIPVYALYAGVRKNVVPSSALAEVGTAQVSIEALREKLKAIEANHAQFKLTVTDLGGNRAKIEAYGQSSHAAMPEDGINAAGMLLLALKELGAGGGSHEPIAALATVLGMEWDGASLGIKQSDDLSGPLTCNLGLLRYDGNELWAVLDIRYPLSASEPAMTGAAVMTLSPYKMSVAREGGHVPLHMPTDHPVVQELLKVYADVTGLPAYTIAIGGGTYARMMPNTVAFGTMFPGDAETCHMPDERMEIDKFMLSVKIMAHAIERLAGA